MNHRHRRRSRHRQLYYLVGVLPGYTAPVIIATSFDRAETIERAREIKGLVVAANVIYDAANQTQVTT